MWGRVEKYLPPKQSKFQIQKTHPHPENTHTATEQDVTVHVNINFHVWHAHYIFQCTKHLKIHGKIGTLPLHGALGLLEMCMNFSPFPLRMHRNLLVVQSPSQCLIFFLLISVIFTENLFVKYIECALCWESVWENKSDFGAKQNLISLGSCAHQRVFSHGDFVGRAAQQQRCVTAWEELCCWPGAHRKQGALPCSTTARAHGAQELLLQGLWHFLEQGFLSAFVSPWSRERAENRREVAALGQRAERLLLFGVSAEMHLRPALAAKLQMSP